MKIAIIDDFEADSLKIKEYLMEYSQEKHISIQIDVFSDGESFLDALKNTIFDAVFLDIYMEGISGIETAEQLKEINEDCLLIFSTSSESHAVTGFQLRAFHYLVKPYSYSSFKTVMELVDRTLCNRARYIIVKEGRIHVKILLKDIIYTDYSNHYIQIHTTKRMIRVYMSFSEFSALLLCYPQFLTCYRNCIINMDKVQKIEEMDFLLESNIRIPINRIKKNEIKQRYFDYIFLKMN